MTEREVTDFPEPDSPTIPSVLDFLREKDTLSTAAILPRSVLKETDRSLTERIISSCFKAIFDQITGIKIHDHGNKCPGIGINYKKP